MDILFLLQTKIEEIVKYPPSPKCKDWDILGPDNGMSGTGWSVMFENGNLHSLTDDLELYVLPV